MAKIDHTKLNTKRNTAPFFPEASSAKKESGYQAAPSLVITGTDSGFKVQCRGDIRLEDFLKLLTPFMKKQKGLATLNWPSLYFGTPESRKKKFTAPNGPTEEQVAKAPVTDSVITDDDVPWLL